MKKFQKFRSVLLAMAVTLTILPASVFAENSSRMEFTRNGIDYGELTYSKPEGQGDQKTLEIEIYADGSEVVTEQLMFNREQTVTGNYTLTNIAYDINSITSGTEELTVTENGSFTYDSQKDCTLRIELTGNELAPTNYVTLSYDLNGGIGEAPAKRERIKAEYAVNVIVKNTEFSNAGYEFTGWNTCADGKGEHYQATEMITLREDTILYAQWTKSTDAKQYTVTFQKGKHGTISGKDTVTLTVPEGTAWREITVPTVLPDDGFMHTGWGNPATLDPVPFPEASEPIVGDIIFTALYAPAEKPDGKPEVGELKEVHLYQVNGTLENRSVVIRKEIPTGTQLHLSEFIVPQDNGYTYSVISKTVEIQDGEIAAPEGSSDSFIFDHTRAYTLTFTYNRTTGNPGGNPGGDPGSNNKPSNNRPPLHHGTGTGTVTIRDNEIPLAPAPSNLVTIRDAEIPLGALPETGGTDKRLAGVGVLAVLLGTVLTGRKKFKCTRQ